MNTVFDSKPTRRGPKTGNEKIHEFFAREGRPEVVPIRDWIEFWYSQLPPTKQPDIRGRLRAGTNDFTSAYFELQMFAMLKNMGYEVTVEPSLAGGGYNPDYLARCEDEVFYLEATVCGQGAGSLQPTKNEEDASEKLRSALQQANVDMHSNLWLQSEGELNETVSKRMISKPFIDLLKRTTATSVLSNRRQPAHREVFRCGDWTLEGVLEPKNRKNAVGQVWGPARAALGDATEPIRNSLIEKTQDWKSRGPSGEIIVVAISICHSQYFWDDGDETRAILKNPMRRGQTDPWLDELKAIQGILFTNNISLGNEESTRIKLLSNPDRDLPQSLARLTKEHRLAELTGFCPSERQPSRKS